jgi:hypothetical protein
MMRTRFVRRFEALAVAGIAVALLTWPALAQEAPGGGTGTSPRRDQAPRSDAFTPFWVATHTKTAVWSGPEPDAAQFGPAPAGLPLQVVAPQDSARLLVRNPMTDNIGWVDASAVGPIPEPTQQQLSAMVAAATASAFEAWWAMTHKPATAWSGMGDDAVPWKEIPQWRYLQVVQPAEGGRVLTVDPRTNGYAYVDITAIGPVGPPPDAYFAPAPPDDATLGLPGRIVGAPDSYDRPNRADYFSLERLAHNTPVSVEGVIDNDDGGRWYRIGATEYVTADRVRLPAEPTRTWSGRWIDADLKEPVMVTAYEDDRPVYSALAVKGIIAFQTRPGVFSVLRRVQNETMDSETIGIPRTSPLGYYLKDVLYTQYFTGDGAALHYNYWRSDFGYAGSKGCLGLNLDDSKFFWDFASVGTVVYVHN